MRLTLNWLLRLLLLLWLLLLLLIRKPLRRRFRIHVPAGAVEHWPCWLCLGWTMWEELLADGHVLQAVDVLRKAL
jgi:hypothetical protein